MRFQNLRLQNFRNIEFAELPLDAPKTFLLGANGQGKSNLLEALGFVTALRSFRTQAVTALLRKGFKDFRLAFELNHELEGDVALEIHVGAGGRSVLIDGEKVTRLSDFIGRFPVVTLCSADLMLLRGGPGERRRFMDLTFSVADPAYYRALRDFHKGITERNHLLKRGGSAAELSAFEAELAPHAMTVARARAKGMALLSDVLTATYSEIAESEEGPALRFKPNTDCDDAEVYLKTLREGRSRDQLLGATQKGPHRDDFMLSLEVGGAREFASDGQQRGLCVALRLAQANFFSQRLGVAPVVLADDVLGELDPVRKAGFWKACPKDIQIVATGTEAPSAVDEWALHRIVDGAVLQ